MGLLLGHEDFLDLYIQLASNSLLFNSFIHLSN